MKRWKNDSFGLCADPEGEWVRYSDHVEAMKRIAGDGVAQGLTDEQIQSMWNDACKDGPGRPGWSRHIRFARAILAQSAPSASAQQAPVRMFALLERHKRFHMGGDFKLIPVPAGQSLKMDEGSATRKWLHDALGTEFHLVEFVELAAPTPSASPALPERDSSKPTEQQGLFRKFDVRRTDGSDAPGGKHHGCRYFVLDVDHDAHAAAALGAYAAACEATHPELARDLREKWGAAPVALTDDAIADATRGIARLLLGDVRKVDCDIIESHIRALLAASPADQVEDARDTERLDWLAEAKAELRLTVRDDYMLCIGNRAIRTGKTPRDAIDSAMSASKEGA